MQICYEPCEGPVKLQQRCQGGALHGRAKAHYKALHGYLPDSSNISSNKAAIGASSSSNSGHRQSNADSDCEDDDDDDSTPPALYADSAFHLIKQALYKDDPSLMREAAGHHEQNHPCR